MLLIHASILDRHHIASKGNHFAPKTRCVWCKLICFMVELFEGKSKYFDDFQIIKLGLLPVPKKQKKHCD